MRDAIFVTIASTLAKLATNIGKDLLRMFVSLKSACSKRYFLRRKLLGACPSNRTPRS
jgi:hypothetical protein